MTKGWLLLLLLIISCQSVDSQSTDEAVCDGEDEKVCHEKQFFDIQRLEMGKSSLNPQLVFHQLLLPAKLSFSQFRAARDNSWQQRFQYSGQDAVSESC